MVSDDVREALDDAERSFERSPQNVETGLDVDSAELVQLRRACRLLDAASRLREEGYYTVVIESSFVAIERTIQFRLLHDGAMQEDEVISSHRRLYQRGAEVGLYEESIGDRLADLWNQNRTKTYYRLGIATESQAREMHQLATSLHGDLVQGSRSKHECICAR